MHINEFIEVLDTNFRCIDKSLRKLNKNVKKDSRRLGVLTIAMIVVEYKTILNDIEIDELRKEVAKLKKGA